MASEIRVNKINSSSGVGTIMLSPTGVDISGITTVSTLKVGTGVTASEDGDIFFTGVCTATTFAGAHSGSGANLTSLPASQLSGTLPALSAANLTSIPAANVTGTLPAISGANLTSLTAANLTGTLPAISAASLTSVPAANIVGLATAGFERSGGFPSGDFVKLAVATGAGDTGDLIFDNLDVSTYKTFDLTLITKPVTDGAIPRFQWRTGGASGSTIVAAHHQSAYSYLYSDNNQTQNTNMGLTYVKLAEGLGNHAQEGISLLARISVCDANDNGHTENRINTIWWQASCHNDSLMPNWVQGSGTLTSSTSGSGGGSDGTTDYPTGFRIYWSSGNVGNFSYQLYGLKR